MDAAAATRQVVARYRRFADLEAPGRSPLYAALAHDVRRDPDLLAFLAALPEHAWQLPLLFGAVQYPQGPLATRAVRRRGAVAARRRRGGDAGPHDQSNVPARCATLLPALAVLPPPLALVEVGASAGLCLHPDRYSYDYDGHRVTPSRASGVPPFRCAADPNTPLPGAPVEVAWRAGLDLHPLDVDDPDDPDDVAWPDALVWPGEEHLRAQLHAALDLARVEPVPVRAGDPAVDLPALLAEAPRDATLVVFHSAVFPYVVPLRHRRGAARLRRRGPVLARGLAGERVARVDPRDRPDDGRRAPRRAGPALRGRAAAGPRGPARELDRLAVSAQGGIAGRALGRSQ